MVYDVNSGSSRVPRIMMPPLPEPGKGVSQRSTHTEDKSMITARDDGVGFQQHIKRIRKIEVEILHRGFDHPHHCDGELDVL
jgi:hypothetical protein